MDSLERKYVFMLACQRNQKSGTTSGLIESINPIVPMYSSEFSVRRPSCLSSSSQIYGSLLKLLYVSKYFSSSSPTSKRLAKMSGCTPRRLKLLRIVSKLFEFVMSIEILLRISFGSPRQYKQYRVSEPYYGSPSTFTTTENDCFSYLGQLIILSENFRIYLF